MKERRQYETPRLIKHGDLKTITLEWNEVNSDTPQGNADTAFSVLPKP